MRTREWMATLSRRRRQAGSRDPVDFRAYVYVALMVVLGSMTAAAAKIAVTELPVTLVPARTIRHGGPLPAAVAFGPRRPARG